jgi:hypothetical protein
MKLLPAKSGASARRDAILHRVQRGLVSVANQLERIVSHVDAWAKDVQDIRDLPGTGAEHGAERRVKRSPAEDHLLRTEAKVGVSLTFDRNPNDSGYVSMNGRPSFYLRRQMFLLLTILGTATERDVGGVPGWRTKVELAAALSKQSGQPVEPKRIPGLIYHLREAIANAKENDHLVQMDTRFGYRVAVRR